MQRQEDLCLCTFEVSLVYSRLVRATQWNSLKQEERRKDGRNEGRKKRRNTGRLASGVRCSFLEPPKHKQQMKKEASGIVSG